MKKVKIYVDMDGVLAKWNEKASEEDTHLPGYFRSRETELNAAAMVHLLKMAGLDVEILSSVYVDDHSASEKREWLDNNGLGDIPAVFVPYGKDKHAYIDGSEDVLSVLIDDYGRNLSAWEAEGHLAIKFMNGINSRPKLVVAEDGTVNMKVDSWTGYSIDYRMSPTQLATVVSAIAQAEAAKAA